MQLGDNLCSHTHSTVLPHVVCIAHVGIWRGLAAVCRHAPGHNDTPRIFGEQGKQDF